MNFLITAGPTREYIDPIRFISNASSGRQGIALAREAKRKGHRVILVLGPGTIAPPKNISVVRIISAADMLRVVMRYKKWMDVLIMTAAVGDWKPVRTSGVKIRKTADLRKIMLSQNPDIIACIAKLREQGKTRPRLKLAGFSVDTSGLIRNAMKKLRVKGADLIIANPVDTFCSASTRPVILYKNGKAEKLPRLSKHALARKVIEIMQRNLDV